MTTEIVQDRWMYIERTPKIFRNTYWYTGLTARDARTFNNRLDGPIIDNRIELYQLMRNIGKISHRFSLPNYVQLTLFCGPRKRGMPIDMHIMESMKNRGPGYDHMEYYKIKGERNLWIIITSPYTNHHTEALKKDGFIPVKPLYATNASSYIRVQVMKGARTNTLMSRDEYQTIFGSNNFFTSLPYEPVEEEQPEPSDQQQPDQPEGIHKSLDQDP